VTKGLLAQLRIGGQFRVDLSELGDGRAVLSGPREGGMEDTGFERR